MNANRPEATGPAENFYSGEEARKYSKNSRIQLIQLKMARRAMEILSLPNDCVCNILDIGCGSGLSGSVISEFGHLWTGLDISPDMLIINTMNHAKYNLENPEDGDEPSSEYNEDELEEINEEEDDEIPNPSQEEAGDVANYENNNEYSNLMGKKKDHVHYSHDPINLIEHDVGQGLPFKPGQFDGCISISALQWLCYSNSAGEKPYKRLLGFFQSLYSCLKPGSKAVFQYYPENENQIDMIQYAATKAGFHGGTVVDFPNSTRAKKFYLTLFAGNSPINAKQEMPKALTSPNDATLSADYNARRERDLERRTHRKHSARDKKVSKGSKEWILQHKIKARLQGKDVKPITKYSGRRRKHAF